MRHDHAAVCIGQRRYLDQFGEAAAPADIGLDQITTSHLEQQSETPSRGLVLAGSDHHAARNLAPQLRVTPVVVGWQCLLQPFETVFMRRMGQTRRVVQVQAHPAVEHQPEVVSDALAHIGQFFNVPAQALIPFGRSVLQWHLAPDETHIPRQVRARTGCIENQFIAHRPPEQLVHRFLANLGQQVP